MIRSTPVVWLRLVRTLGSVEARLRKRFPWLVRSYAHLCPAPEPPEPIPPEAVAALTAELSTYFARHRSPEVTRTRQAYRNHTLTPDLEPDAPSTRHRFRCLGEDDDGRPCGAESGEFEEFEDARGWAFVHLKERPEHTSFEQVLCRPWLMRPGEWL